MQTDSVWECEPKKYPKLVWANIFSWYFINICSGCVLKQIQVYTWLLHMNKEWHIHNSVSNISVKGCVLLQWNRIDSKALVFHLLALKPRCYFSVAWAEGISSSGFSSWKRGRVRCLQITRKSRITKKRQASTKRTTAKKRWNMNVNEQVDLEHEWEHTRLHHSHPNLLNLHSFVESLLG